MSRQSRLTLAALSVVALLAGLFVAPAAQALPQQCDEKCTFTTPCNILCAMGRFVITCGDYGICSGGGAAPAGADDLAFLDAEPTDDTAAAEATALVGGAPFAPTAASPAACPPF